MTRVLTPHFTLEDLTITEHRDIDNTPSPAMLVNVRYLANQLEHVRAVAKAPVVVSSGYRCPVLNKVIGSSPGSDHEFGLAADCRAVGMTVTQFFLALYAAWDALKYRQMIWEFGRWVHLAFERPGAGQKVIKPINRTLVIHTKAGGYLPYTPTMDLK